ncbi:F-box/kelch-repeat protein At3g23880-like [Rhododendron vialii]|uniref:F-box/kelch-repeat protein At3g23880-like n=1 Tax=Rhododendron vialii TaxID=182163 RepID=UPI00265DAE24|nr:F-box/kelch-repeat protein At3g23880-like [Rhododendron vialii]
MASSKSAVARITFDLPFEITLEILSRLPVKSLLRFKSVCKTWYDLIKTPDFIAKHLLTPVTLNPTPLLETGFSYKTESHIISLIYNDGFNNEGIDLNFPFLERRNIRRIPWDYGGDNYFFIGGICNGLVCVSLSWFGYPLFLCNPSTRQFREIPGAEWNCEGYYVQHVKQVSFGFGFHPSANDYKLIRIVLHLDTNFQESIRADLYVMSTDTWTRIGYNNNLLSFFGEMNEWGEYDSIVEIDESFASAVLNGVFYWPARVVPTHQMVVMSFDMGNEEFRRIRTPECLDGTWDLPNWTFTELDGKLAVVVVSPHERCFDVWVLNENESSWTNQVKVGSFPRIAGDMDDGEDRLFTVMGGGKDGKLLMTDYKYTAGELKLFSYDTKTRQTMDLYFGQVYFECSVYLYAGTLLPVMQANEIVLNK